MRKESEVFHNQRNHDRAGGLERAAVMVESLLAKEIKYATGESVNRGDTVACGGEEFRVDRIDYQSGILRSYVSPAGYSASNCVLIKRGV